MPTNRPVAAYQIRLSALSRDARRVIGAAHIANGKVEIPTSWTSLVDLRAPSFQAKIQARSGMAPAGAGLSTFDPIEGPFSAQGASQSPWAQSLEFCRDIAQSRSGDAPTLVSWLSCWAKTPSNVGSFFPQNVDVSSKTERLVWRAKRVINLLCYGLPILSQFDVKVQTLIWEHLIGDIVKLGAPTTTLWASLMSGFHPLSPRALWLRALALAGVEVACPGLVQSSIVSDATAHLKKCIQSDGTMQGHSIMATLAAGLDLTMVATLPDLKDHQAKTAQALASLRHDSGNLVMLAEGDGEYTSALNMILGNEVRQKSAVLANIAIARASAGATNIWLSASVVGRRWVGLCDVEMNALPMLVNLGTANTGIMLNGDAQQSTCKVKRRDDDDHYILESTSTFTIGGAAFSFCRQIRLAKNGRQISGEDFVSALDGANFCPVKKLSFVLPQFCLTAIAPDGRSVLIVRPDKSAWRLRIEHGDLSVVEVSSQSLTGKSTSLGKIIDCTQVNAWQNGTFRTIWNFTSEDMQ
jgi:hypothetical protein